MADLIPFEVSSTNYTLITMYDNVSYNIDVWWNSRDSAWYLAFSEGDGTVILPSVKLVLGAKIGRRCQHALFQNNTFQAVDTAGTGVDAGFDDLGTRIVVIRVSNSEVTRT